jgi:deoxyribose-phosphate aldolase
MHQFAPYLDFANHHGNATPDDVKKLCENVTKYGFHAAFVNPIYVALAKSMGVRVGTAISFPLGQDTVDTKVAAAVQAITHGADELDVVPDTALLLTDPTGAKYLSEMQTVCAATKAARPDVIVKFILEVGYLTPEQISLGAAMIQKSGADYVKFATGMGPRGASLEDFALVRKAVGPDMKIKVSGGIDTYEEAEGFIKAGVTRIGTSKAIEIVS